jgi:hypothetical protein
MPFSTPLTFCSIGVATDASTSVAEAPTNVVVIWTIGGTTSGYCAIGGRTSPRAREHGDDGDHHRHDRRLTKKRAIAYLVPARLAVRIRRERGGRLGDTCAVADALEPLDDDLVAGLQALFDHPQPSTRGPDLDVAKRTLLSGSDDREDCRGSEAPCTRPLRARGVRPSDLDSKRARPVLGRVARAYRVWEC